MNYTPPQEPGRCLEAACRAMSSHVCWQKKETWNKKSPSRTSLVVQRLRIHLVIEGTWVRPLVRELRCHRATKPMHHNKRSRMLQQETCMPQLQPDAAK